MDTPLVLDAALLGDDDSPAGRAAPHTDAAAAGAARTTSLKLS